MTTSWRGNILGFIRRAAAPKVARTNATLWALLGGCRFFLAGVVLNSHVGMVFAADRSYFDLPSFYQFGRSLAPLAAIVGFLVISGFSIAHSYSQQGGFYRRRVARILPTLWFATLGFAAVLLLTGPIGTTNGAVIPEPSALGVLVVLFGFNAIVIGSFLGPAWTLSVEIIFYALTPVIARLAQPVMLLLIAASAAFYLMNRWLQLPPLPDALYGIPVLALFWAWGIGFYLYRYATPLSAVIVCVLCVEMLALYNYAGGKQHFITYSVVLLVLFFGADAVIAPWLRKALAYLGDLSYPLYLLHMPVIVVLNGLYGVDSPAVLFLASVALSVVCLHAVEQPLRGLILGRRSPTAVVPETGDRVASPGEAHLRATGPS